MTACILALWRSELWAIQLLKFLVNRKEKCFKTVRKFRGSGWHIQLVLKLTSAVNIQQFCLLLIARMQTNTLERAHLAHPRNLTRPEAAASAASTCALKIEPSKWGCWGLFAVCNINEHLAFTNPMRTEKCSKTVIMSFCLEKLSRLTF